MTTAEPFDTQWTVAISPAESGSQHHNTGALITAYTMLWVPYSIMGPKTLFSLLRLLY